jgi:hypothetical protein
VTDETTTLVEYQVAKFDFLCIVHRLAARSTRAICSSALNYIIHPLGGLTGFFFIGNVISVGISD